MSKEIIICEKENLAAIIENGRVVEFYLSEGEQQVGDILLGRVESIVPAIEAAFVNIGRDKNGFIHVADLPTSRARQAGIKQALKIKQPLLVQIAKEPTGSKGARLTSMLSIPGRYLVLTPFERRIGISKRITSEAERGRLMRILSQIVQPGYGCVVRTEATGQTEAALQEDLDGLLKAWQEILRLSEEVQAPALLFRDQDMLHRVLRESFTPDVEKVLIDSPDAQRRALDLCRSWGGGEAVRRVQLHRGTRTLATQYNLFREIEQSIQPRVPMPSGGYLIIEQTEALTVIDVNSGRLTSEAGLPETILKTNREAAIEVARQLRLRDIGGVIVVDFIDMSEPRDQQIVWQTLAEAVKPDRAQPQIGYFSDIGLIEMTRRRQRQSLLEQLSMPCPHCQGIGRVRNNLYRSDMLSQAGVDSRVQLAEILKEIVHEPVAIERPASTRPPAEELEAGGGEFRRERGRRDGRDRGDRDRGDRDHEAGTSARRDRDAEAAPRRERDSELAPRREGGRFDSRRPAGGERFVAPEPVARFEEETVPFQPAPFDEARPAPSGEPRRDDGRRRRRRGRGGADVAAAETTGTTAVNAEPWTDGDESTEVMPWDVPLTGGVSLVGLDELAVEALAELDASVAVTFDEPTFDEPTFEEGGTFEEEAVPFVRPVLTAPEPLAAVTEDEVVLDVEPLAEAPALIAIPVIEAVAEEEEEEVTIRPVRRPRRPAVKKKTVAELAAEAAAAAAAEAVAEAEAVPDPEPVVAAAEAEVPADDEASPKGARTAARRRVRSFAPRRGPKA
ncbi:MAG: Rne/Rng family ribonuclease [Candidatus Sericytochromatia bacterium]|nr:Rne/Rng family ribonuclease [Candidatus Sericytochromatia bacterium]